MRVPQYKQQTQRTTPNVPTPVMPKPEFAEPVKGAFGKEVYQARAQVGGQLMKLADLLQKRAEEKRDLENKNISAQVETQYRKAVEDRLFNPEQEEIDINGQKVSRPVGILNRKLSLAKGATQEFDDWHAKNIGKYLDSVPDPTYQQDLAIKLQNDYMAKRQSVIKHQTKEEQDYLVEGFKSNVAQQVNDAYGAQTPYGLKIAIDNAVLAQNDLNLAEGYDPVKAKMEIQETVKNITEKSILSALQRDRTGEASRELLGSVKDKLSKENFDALNKDIKDSSKKLINDTKNNTLRTQVANEAKILDGIIKGDLDFMTISNIKQMTAAGDVRKEFGKAAIKALLKPIDEFDYDDKGNDEAFVTLAQGIFEARNQHDIGDRLIDILDGFNKDNLSQRNMTLLIQTAKEFGGNVKADNAMRAAVNWARNNNVNPAEMVSDYLSSMKAGLGPEEAASEAIKNSSLKNGIQEEPKEEEKAPEKEKEDTVPFGFSGKLQPLKGGGLENLLKKIKGIGEIKKGFASMIASTPQVLGAFIKEYGESPEENSHFWEDVFYFHPSAPLVKALNSTRQAKEIRDVVKEESVKLGDVTIEANREWLLAKGLVRPEADVFDQVMFDIGSGVASIATAVGMTVITKNPVAASVTFGALQKGQIYQEAREAGLSPDQASLRSSAAGVVEGALEFVGLEFFLKNYGGRLLNVGMRALNEGLQETSQQLGEDFIATWRKKNGFQMAKDAVYAGALGILLGGGTSTVLDIAQKGGYIRQLESAGLDKESAEGIVANTGEALKGEVQSVVNEMEGQKATEEGAEAEQGEVEPPKAQPGAKPQGKQGIYYRGGGEGSMPKGMTAQDIINYEQDELGNQDITIEKGVDPSKIKSDNLEWVTIDAESAKEYGEVVEQEYPNAKIIARDSQGGVLIEKGEGKGKAQQGKGEKEYYQMTREEFENSSFMKYAKETRKGIKGNEAIDLMQRMVDEGIASIEDANFVKQEPGFEGQVTGVQNISEGKPIPSKPVEGDMKQALSNISRWNTFRNAFDFGHRNTILRALEEGKNVPKEVLAEYIDWTDGSGNDTWAADALRKLYPGEDTDLLIEKGLELSKAKSEYWQSELPISMAKRQVIEKRGAKTFEDFRKQLNEMLYGDDDATKSFARQILNFSDKRYGRLEDFYEVVKGDKPIPKDIQGLKTKRDLLQKEVDDLSGKGTSWQKAQQGKGEANLIAEAKKYKTEEEFRKSLGRPLFHGSKDYIESFDSEMLGKGAGGESSKEGFFFTDNYEDALNYSDLVGGEEGKVTKVWLDIKNPKEIDLIKNKEGIYPKKGLQKEIELAKKEGHDGLIVKGIMDTPGKIGSGSVHTIVFDKGNIKTESQLTSIWQKAQEEGGAIDIDVIPGVKKASEIIETISSPDLIAEAKKYKSAEEFVQGIKREVPIVFGEDKLINVEETIKNLPKVKEGYERFYRAEGGKYKASDLWKQEDFPLPKGAIKGEVEFFTEDLKFADYYRDSYGENAKILYIDVPKGLAIQSDKFPTEYIINKSQLTSIWQKAQGEGTEKPPAEPPETAQGQPSEQPEKKPDINTKSGQADILGILQKSFTGAKDFLNNIFNPATSAIKTAGKGAYASTIKAIHTPEAENLGFNNQQSEALDKSFAEIEKHFSELPKDDVNDFNLIRGEAQSEEGKALQGNAKTKIDKSDKGVKDLLASIKESSDFVYEYAKANGIDMDYFEDYFYGAYKNPDKVNAFIDYWRSTEKYTKEKTLPTIADAQAFGLELKNPNPITNIRQELRAVAQRVGLMKLKEEIIANEPSYAVETAKATPEQRQKFDTINDPVFRGMLFDPAYANFVNSLLSTNKISGNNFLSGLRRAAILAQQVKFFGSMFHLQQITKAAVSDQALGIFDKEGWEVVKKSFKPIDTKDPQYKEYVNLGGGHRYSVESTAQTDLEKFINGFVDVVTKGTKLESAAGEIKKGIMLKFIPAGPGMIKWMFDEYIPAVKFFKYQQEAAILSEQLGRPITDAEKIDVIKTGQNFYGEMNERLFGRSGTVTSAMRLIFTAPGYGEGNFRTLFMSVEDIGKGAESVIKGKKPTTHGLRNIRNVVSTLFTTLVLSTIGTMIMTRKPPEVPKNGNDVRDLFKIKTDMVDGNGDTVYYDMMGYGKDYWELYGNLLTGRAQNIPGNLGRRVSYMTATGFRAMTDASTIFTGGMVYDYKADPLYYRTDEPLVKLGKFLKHEALVARPISSSVYEQSIKKGGNPVLSAMAAGIGIRPTTSEAVKETKAARSDLYALSDSKESKGIELKKMYNENPELAIKEAFNFNKRQIAKLKEIAKKQGITETSDSQIRNKYLIFKVGGQREKTGTSVDYMYKTTGKSPKRIELFDKKQRNELGQLIKEIGVGESK